MYVVINGGGKVGEYLAQRMLEAGNEVAIIEKDLETADRLSATLSGPVLIIHGDGCMSTFQEDADIRHADVFVSTTGQDDANLVSCEIANHVFNVPRVIARVNSPKNLRIFREVGIECVSSTSLIAKIIEEDAMLGGISVLSSMSEGNVALSEVTIPRMKHFNNDEGLLAQDIELPEGCLIVAVQHADSDDMDVVGESVRVYPGDVIVIASDKEKTPDALAALKQL